MSVLCRCRGGWYEFIFDIGVFIFDWQCPRLGTGGNIPSVLFSTPLGESGISGRAVSAAVWLQFVCAVPAGDAGIADAGGKSVVEKDHALCGHGVGDHGTGICGRADLYPRHENQAVGLF